MMTCCQTATGPAWVVLDSRVRSRFRGLPGFPRIESTHAAECGVVALPKHSSSDPTGRTHLPAERLVRELNDWRPSRARLGTSATPSGRNCALERPEHSSYAQLGLTRSLGCPPRRPPWSRLGESNPRPTHYEQDSECPTPSRQCHIPSSSGSLYHRRPRPSRVVVSKVLARPLLLLALMIHGDRSLPWDGCRAG
jgi:hypothetical protein